MPRLIDLTLTYRLGMRGVSWEAATTAEREGWNTRMLHLYSHAGTRMDAQTHFAAGPGTIDQTPLDSCMGPAWIVDVPDCPPRELLTTAHLGRLERDFQSGESILVRTLWSRHVDDAKLYRDGLPRISEELARWCVQRGVRVLGVEPPSVADVNDRQELTLIHKILLAGQVTIVEGLVHLDQLRLPRVFFCAAPLKIDGGDGAPCRAFAIEDSPLLQPQAVWP